MKTANFPVIGTLDETLPDEEDPQYQSASLALTLHKIIKDLSDESFEFQQAEPSDFSAFGTDTQDGMEDYLDRFDELITTGVSEMAASLPDVLPIIAALLSGGAEPVMAILLKGVLDTILRHADVRAEKAGGDPDSVDVEAIVAELESIDGKLEAEDKDEATASVAALLEDIRSQVETTLNEFTINLHGSEISQSWSVGPLEEE